MMISTSILANERDKRERQDSLIFLLEKILILSYLNDLISFRSQWLVSGKRWKASLVSVGTEDLEGRWGEGTGRKRH
jgi:hypothetical protein